MANIKGYTNRISVLKNMQKVMRAMNMIATIKLRKLFRLQTSLSLFEKSIDVISEDISSALMYLRHPLITGPKDIQKANIIIFTADKGLCGSHNSSVLRALDTLVRKKTESNIKVDVTCIGNRGANYCKRKEYEIYHHAEINERVFSLETLKEISAKIFGRLMDNEAQEIYLICNYFVSTLNQETRTFKLIPFNRDLHEDEGIKDKEKNSEVRASTEPEPEQFIISAGGLYLYYKLHSALINSYLSEQSARMTAMENATHNSEGLISHYVALRNRARQAAITNELIEIVSGKEALKG